MKLYTYDPAPNPRRLALFLKLKGLAIDTQQVDLLANEQLGDAYRQINPALSVPALVLDDGTLRSRQRSVWHATPDAAPLPLMGSTAAERAQVISWCHRLFSGRLTAIAGALRNRCSRWQKIRGESCQRVHRSGDVCAGALVPVLQVGAFVRHRLPDPCQEIDAHQQIDIRVYGMIARHPL